MRADGWGMWGAGEREGGVSIQKLGRLRELPSLDPCSDKVDLRVTTDIQQTDRKSIKP